MFERAIVSMSVVFLVLLAVPGMGEIPLPDAIVFGIVRSREGVPLDPTGLEAQVNRGARGFLTVPAEVVESDGATYYVVRIPMETSIGAPGPDRSAAREGDSLVSLRLAGEPLSLDAPTPTLEAGAVARIDASSDSSAPVSRFRRGDCNGDDRYDVSDPISLLGYLFLGNATPPCLDACDGDGDLALGITDAIFVLANLFTGGPAPPPPAASCGPSPVPSSLTCLESPCAGV